MKTKSYWLKANGHIEEIPIYDIFKKKHKNHMIVRLSDRNIYIYEGGLKISVVGPRFRALQTLFRGVDIDLTLKGLKALKKSLGDRS